MWNVVPIFLRMYFSLVLTFFLKLRLSDCMLLNRFQHLSVTFRILKIGLSHFCSSTSFYSKSEIVEGCHEILNCYVFIFRAIFLKFNIFEVVTLHKKWSFSLRINSVNVTKSARNFRIGQMYWRNFFFFVIFYLTWH